MCGIAGIYLFEHNSAESRTNKEKVLSLLRHRGPDKQAVVNLKRAVFFHSRLTIVDTSAASDQPFVNKEHDVALVFNGEIFNYKSLQQRLSHLKSNGDTEVLFELLRRDQKNCLDRLNGFFSFAYYQEKENYLLLARDRFGVKPLYYYVDKNKFAFASELKPLMELAGPQEINEQQLYTYFRLNYCAGPESIFKNIFKVLPGQCIEITNNQLSISNWYQASKTDQTGDIAVLLEDAVKIRLQADVPVGTFLSGGLDSSIISALAKKHKPELKTFSIGFENESYFDESRYSEMVARHIGSDHTVFRLNEEHFIEHIGNFLGCIDEPFADSSAFNFYMLCKLTRQHVKVALSGDGADELFKGYHKHRALLVSDHFSARVFAGFTSLVPAYRSSRHGSFQNKLRQLKKFGTLAKLPAEEKQKFLASISTDQDVKELLKQRVPLKYFDSLFKAEPRFSDFAFDDAFDLQTVLPDDMLVKADRFSMQHGIEIRNPFLDYRVVELALNLPDRQKLTKNNQKIILKDRFKQLLPGEIFSRPKRGFELPLQKWLSGQLRSRVENEWLNPEKLRAENILNAEAAGQITSELFSKRPGDSAARLWAVIVFESWLDNFKDYIKH